MASRRRFQSYPRGVRHSFLREERTRQPLRSAKGCAAEHTKIPTLLKRFRRMEVKVQDEDTKVIVRQENGQFYYSCGKILLPGLRKQLPYKKTYYSKSG
jgi:hypothetical protein